MSVSGFTPTAVSYTHLDVYKRQAEHCAIEYRNLAEILPALYKKYK